MGIAKNQNSLCAANDWSVGGTSGSGIYAPDGKSAGYIVSVHRTSHWAAKRASGFKFGALRYGEANGRVLSLAETRRDGETMNTLDRDLFKRGYLVLYRPKARWTREQFETRARKQGRIVDVL